MVNAGSWRRGALGDRLWGASAVHGLRSSAVTSAGVTLALAAVLTACGTSDAPRADGPQAGPSASSTATSAASASSSSSSSPTRTHASGGSSHAPTSSSDAPTEGPTGSPSGVPTPTGAPTSAPTGATSTPVSVEQPTSTTTPSGLPGLDPPKSKGPLVSRPLPSAASANGRLVHGYPAVLRPGSRSTIDSSSVSPSGSVLQVSLLADARTDAASVEATFRRRLVARGFIEKPVSAVGGSRALAFRRGDDLVIVTTTPATAPATRTAYIVFASLQAAA